MIRTYTTVRLTGFAKLDGIVPDMPARTKYLTGCKCRVTVFSKHLQVAQIWKRSDRIRQSTPK